MKFKDLTGKKFGRLTVIKRVGDKKQTQYLCECECGNKKIVYASNLLRGKSISCGCYRKEKLHNDRVKILKPGTKIGRLTILEYLGQKQHNGMYKVQCTCGAISIVLKSDIEKSTYSSPICCSRRKNKIESKIYKNNTTGVKGVYRNKNKYEANIGFYGHHYYLGSYDNIDLAEEARKIAEEKIFKPWLELYKNEKKLPTPTKEEVREKLKEVLSND